MLPDNSSSLCCHCSFSTDVNGGKRFHFGSNLDKPFTSIRLTPSYVLLAGLAVTDFCTGLLTVPAYVVTTVSKLARK